MYIQDCLLGKKLANVDLFANCLPDAEKIDDLILKPAGFDDPEKADANNLLATRGPASHAWNLAKKPMGKLKSWI